MDETKILSDSAEDMGIKPKVSLWKKFLCLINGHDWDWNIKMCAPERTCKRCKKEE